MGNETPELRVDHVGIAVQEPDTLESLLRLLGARKLADEPAGGYRWIYYELGDASRIELITPTEDDNFLTEYLEENGPGLHHVTLEVGDIDAVVELLDENGVRVVDRADRKEYKEAFISPRSTDGVLFQLMEYGENYVEEYGEPGVDEDLVIAGRALSDECSG